MNEINTIIKSFLESYSKEKNKMYIKKIQYIDKIIKKEYDKFKF